MKKDYHYYHKKVVIYAIAAIGLFLISIAPIFIHFVPDGSRVLIGCIQIAAVVIAFSLYLLSLINHSKRDNILLTERRTEKKKAFNNVLFLIRDGKTQQAIDALYDYDNKYN
jgi:hypothetical protein